MKNYRIKNITFFCAVLSVALLSCKEEVEEGVYENDSFLSLSEEDSELIDFSFKLHSDIIASNPNANAVMRLNMDEDGKLTVMYNLEKDGSSEYAKTRSSETSLELLCKDEEFSDEFSSCIKENIDAGICVTIRTCAYCAYECDGGDNNSDDD